MGCPIFIWWCCSCCCSCPSCSSSSSCSWNPLFPNQNLSDCPWYRLVQKWSNWVPPQILWFILIFPIQMSTNYGEISLFRTYMNIYIYIQSTYCSMWKENTHTLYIYIYYIYTTTIYTVYPHKMVCLDPCFSWFWHGQNYHTLIRLQDEAQTMRQRVAAPQVDEGPKGVPNQHVSTVKNPLQ